MDFNTAMAMSDEGFMAWGEDIESAQEDATNWSTQEQIIASLRLSKLVKQKEG